MKSASLAEVTVASVIPVVPDIVDNAIFSLFYTIYKFYPNAAAIEIENAFVAAPVDVINVPDSLGIVALNDTISQNKILGRTFNASVKQRTIKETTIVKELPKTKIFYGLEGGFNKADVVSSVGAGVLINTKKDKIYQLGLGVNNQTTDGINGGFSPYIRGGVYWKIKLKK